MKLRVSLPFDVKLARVDDGLVTAVCHELDVSVLAPTVERAVEKIEKRITERLRAAAKR